MTAPVMAGIGVIVSASLLFDINGRVKREPALLGTAKVVNLKKVANSCEFSNKLFSARVHVCIATHDSHYG